MPRSLFLALAICAILVRCAPSGFAATLDEAWSQLANNSYLDAAAAFTEAAEAEEGAARASALRGLFWSWTGRADERALEAALEAVIAEPTYPANDWLLAQVGQIVGIHGAPDDWATQLARLKTALADVPMLAPHLSHLQAAYADQKGNWDELASHVAESGMICDVLVCGPFENVAGSGMSIVRPPEEEIDLDGEYPGLGGMPVRWIAPRCGPYAVVDLDEIMDSQLNASMYVVTHLRVDEPTDVLLHLAGGGAFRVWVNGELRLAEDDVRYGLYQMYELPVRLRAGWNRVLAKVGAEDEPMAFTLRVSDREGHVLRPAVQATPPPSLVEQAQDEGTPASRLQTFPAQSWRHRWEQRPLGDTLADRLIVAMGLLDLSFVEEAESLVDQLESDHPQSELVGRLRVRTLEQRQSAAADGVQRAWAEKAPESFVARAAAAAALRSQGEVDRSREAIEQLRRDFPDNAMVEMTYVWSLLGRGETARALEIAQSVHEANRKDMGIQRMYYEVLQQLNRQADYRHAVAEDLALRPDLPDLALRLASIEMQRHDVDAAIEQYRHALRANGSPPLVYERMATAYESLNRTDEAIQACETALEWSPYSASLHERLARLLLTAERRDEAVEHLQTALDIDPADSSARELLRKLEGRSELSALFERDDPRQLLEADLSWIQAPAQACYLVDQVELMVFPGGAQNYRRHYAILVRDEGGVANYRTLEENTAGLEIARILKPDGQEIEAEVGWGEITFPDLAPGDAIEIRVQSESPPLPGLADHFWHGNAFQYEIPCLRSRFSLLIPKSLTFQQRVHNGELGHQQRDADDWTIHEWNAERIEALPIETSSPPALDQVLWLDVSSLASWDMLVKWFRSESEGRLRATAPVREMVARVTAEASTDSARIHALSDYVRTNIEYEGGQFIDSPTVPRTAEEVLRTKFGDCKDQSGLIIAALRELGITAHFALVNSREVTTLEYLPSPRFTHAIVYARTADDRVYWIDPTDEQLGFPNVPSILEGMTALLIDPELDSPFVVIPLDDPAQNGMLSRLRVSVTEDERLRIEGECAYWGEEAALLRMIAEYVPEYMETGLKEILGSSHPGAVISTVEYELGETLEDRATVTFALEAPAHLANAGSMKVLELPWTMWFVPSELVPTETRRTPLEVVEWRGTYVEEITLQLPPNLRPLELTPAVHIEEDFGAFELTRKAPQADQLVCRKQLRLSRPQVAPQGYASFREFVLAALDAEREQVVLTAAAP